MSGGAKPEGLGGWARERAPSLLFQTAEERGSYRATCDCALKALDRKSVV